jgi:acetylornithine deacetylase/succinyl-diaminopimelate desuccinylase-like protein
MDSEVFCGSMGDWPLLTDQQRQQGVAQLVAAGVAVIVGTGAQNTRVLPYTPDSSDMVRHGIPTLNYGPTGRTRTDVVGQRDYGAGNWDPSQGEHVNIDDLYKGAQVYAALALNICSQRRADLGIEP